MRRVPQTAEYLLSGFTRDAAAAKVVLSDLVIVVTGFEDSEVIQRCIEFTGIAREAEALVVAVTRSLSGRGNDDPLQGAHAVIPITLRA